jgi:hypothetical protein
MKLKIALLALLLSVGAFAQNKTTNNDLTAPVVKTATNSFAAEKASRNGNLAVIIHHGKGDPVSGEKYAKGFANGFADPKATNNKPIFISAFHTERNGPAPTYVEVFMDGQKWNFKDHYQLTPSNAWKLKPLIMKEFTDLHGTSKIIKTTLKKQ